jgi:hypothetical protein
MLDQGKMERLSGEKCNYDRALKYLRFPKNFSPTLKFCGEKQHFLI